MKKFKRKLTLILAGIYLLGCFSAFAESLENSGFSESEPGGVSAFESGGAQLQDFGESFDEYNDFAEPVTYAPMFYLPHNMRGVIISPETDFLLTPEDGKNEVIAQLDEVFSRVSDIGLNSVIIKTSVEGRPYYDLDMNRNGKEDLLKLAVETAQSHYLGVYLIYDIGHVVNPLSDSDLNSAAAINALVSEVHRLTIKYPCDGIILDNYYNDPEVNNFSRYMKLGSGIGYQNWLYDSTEYLFETAGEVVRMTDNSVPVGVMINDSWANSSSMPDGSPTEDSVQAFFDGFADTKKYIEQGFADFITLRCYGSLTDNNLPFEQTAQWWGELCEENNIPMYLIHYNEKLGGNSPGWLSEDQILRQLKTAKESVTAYSGSIFNSYSAIRQNTLNSAETLKKYYADLIDEDSLLKDLEMQSPKNFNFTTYEPTVDFMGSFDQNFDVYFNGNKITLNDAGNFYFEEPLQIGTNIFTLRHKDRTYTYRIERKIIVMREINASIIEGKTIRVDGGTSITLEAIAYKGATVTATINGQTVKLTEQTGIQDEDINSSYTTFRGRYKVPDGVIGTEQALGQISVQASFMGQSRTILGASVFVNAKPEPPKQDIKAVMFDESALGTGEVVGRIDPVRGRDEQVTLVRINNNNTTIFDAKTTGTVFDPRFGQLPAGTVDYYRSNVGGFYTTESGKRFLADESSLTEGTGIGENPLVVKAGGTFNGKSYLEISLDTKISYNVEVAGLNFFSDWGSDYNIRNFNSEFIYITFDNVTSVTKLPSFEKNYVFSSGRWEQVTIDGIAKFRLVLQLRSSGVYAGNSAYYNSDGNLMLTFPVLTNSLAGMTIVIDPGHGYGVSPDKFDPGAIGHITEQTANLAVAKRLESKLTAMGANVIRLKSEQSFILTKNRPVAARSYNCDLFISLHANKVAGNSDARGTEVYYYTPFSQPLAEAISGSVSSYFSKNVYSDGADKNRGAKHSYFWVTVQQDFPSVLVEMGFVSNLEDAMALANDAHQDGIADAIVRGIQTYLSRSSVTYSADGTAEIPSNFIPEQPQIPEPDPEREPEDIPEPEYTENTDTLEEFDEIDIFDTIIY
ncbi:MAG: N-acetylmuramoyl-L-alanine amidase [Oscillospiraceae bacterium]|nr:N-acetylmuramoyl-L-alanine amidase [Oscillospiraceae bacterium]